MKIPVRNDDFNPVYTVKKDGWKTVVEATFTKDGKRYGFAAQLSGPFVGERKEVVEQSLYDTYVAVCG